MSQSHKTKEEILQELESIKGLLLEEDDIPLLQELEHQLMQELTSHIHKTELEPTSENHFPLSQDPSVLPGQGTLFDEPLGAFDEPSGAFDETQGAFDEPLDASLFQEPTSKTATSATPAHINSSAARPQVKALGENPFLPQHIRARLHGNNPPPLYDFATNAKMTGPNKSKDYKSNPSRQQLINDVLTTMMPKIEQELKHRLYTMSVKDLEKLLEDED